MELVDLIPEAPPKGLIPAMHKQERWWTTGVLSYKCISKADGEALLDHDDMAGVYRGNITARPALLRCSECGKMALADYLHGSKHRHCDPDGVGIWTGGIGKNEGYFRNGEKLLCPICGEQVTLRHTRDLRYGEVEDHFVVVPTVRQGCLILEQWHIVRDIGRNSDARWHSSPVMAYILDGKKWHKFVHARRAPFGAGIYSLGKWEELKGIQDTLNAPFMYLEDLPDLEGTSLENAKLWEYADQTYHKNCFFPIAYIRLYLKHPQVENLITTDMGRMIGQAIEEECWDSGSIYHGPYTRVPQLKWIDWKAAKPHKMLGLTKEQLRMVRQDGWDYRKLKFWNQQKENVAFEEVVQALKAKPLYEINQIIELKAPLTKTLRYLQKQRTGWFTLRDYWSMAKKARLDLDEEIVCWPPRLQDAHDRLQVTIKYEKDAKQRAAFAAMTERCKGLAWEHGGICIRPAESPEELVEEGRVLHHCVGGYSNAHAQGRIILFIRHTRRPERSWFTLNVDVKSKTVLQNHGYGNERSPRGKTLQIPKEVQEFVSLWQKEVLNHWKLPAEPKQQEKTKSPAA